MWAKAFLPWCALAIAAIIMCASFAKTAAPTPFAYDEADYMYAGTRGLIDNYLDRPSMSLMAFIQNGLELRRDRSKRSTMSEYVRSSGDINFYRHYHGPVYAYWIALCTLAGAHSEAVYRASGLIVHALSSCMILWFFPRTFPSLPPISGLIAALAFLLNRTALVTSTSITPHVMFTLFAGLTLFLMARYAQKLEVRYWYATVVALAGAVCSVETAFVLVCAVVLTLVIIAGGRGWKYVALALIKGAGVFLVAVLVFWPKGVLQLNLPRGYAYLAYIALYRKTFSPISPAALWGSRFLSYPLEFFPAALVLAVAIACIRKYHHRRETLPFLIYACMFVAVTIVITAPYTHYYGSLLISCAVLGGVVFGEIWLGVKMPARAALAVVTLAAMTGMALDYYREASHATRPAYLADVVKYVRGKAAADGPLYVPYTLVPTLHYYCPDFKAVAYDVDWTPGALAAAVLREPRAALLCPQSTCEAVRNQIPQPMPFETSQVSSADESGEPLFVAHVMRETPDR